MISVGRKKGPRIGGWVPEVEEKPGWTIVIDDPARPLAAVEESFSPSVTG